jgi:hypothetical protein
MAAGPVEARLELTVDELKIHLRIDGDTENGWLADALATAMQRADAFLQELFEDDDGEPADIPEAVKTWCKEVVGRAYELRGSGLTTESASGLGSQTWSDLDFSGIAHLKNLDKDTGVPPI